MTRVNHTVCPFCGDEHDRSTAVVRGRAVGIEPTMKPGDATMCVRCGEFSVMGGDEMLRAPTLAESAALYADPAVKRMCEAWSELDAKKRRPG